VNNKGQRIFIYFRAEKLSPTGPGRQGCKVKELSSFTVFPTKAVAKNPMLFSFDYRRNLMGFHRSEQCRDTAVANLGARL